MKKTGTIASKIASNIARLVITGAIVCNAGCYGLNESSGHFECATERPYCPGGQYCSTACGRCLTVGTVCQPPLDGGGADATDAASAADAHADAGPDGAACVAAADCQSGVCTNNKCAAPTCTDGVKNGAETDKDCGGGTCPKCGDGKACGGYPENCQSNKCSGEPGKEICAAP